MTGECIRVWRPRRLLADPISQTLATSFAVMGLGMFTGVVAARLVGVEGRGIYAMLLLGPTLLAAIGELGLPASYVYYAALGRSPAQLARNATWLTSIQAAILLALGGPVVLIYVAGNSEGWQAEEAVFLLAFVPISLLTRYLISLYQGLGRMRVFNSARLLLAGTHALILAIGWALDIDSIAFLLLALLAGNMAAVVFVATKAGEFGRASCRFDGTVARNCLQHGWRAHVGAINPLDVAQIDLAFVVLFLGPYEAGLYAVALAVATAIRTVGLVFSLVVQPKVTRASSSEEVRGAVGRALTQTGGGSVGLALIAILFAPHVVEILYGREFLPAVDVTRALAVVAVAGSVRTVLASAIRGLGHPGLSSVGEAAALLTAAASLAVMVPEYGLVGAAYGLATAYLVGLGISGTALIALLHRQTRAVERSSHTDENPVDSNVQADQPNASRRC